MSVVLIHVFLGYRYLIVSEYGAHISLNWFITDYFSNLFRIGVPIFLMLSGALSLGRDWDIKSFLGRRIPRIIGPFVFWTVAISLSVMIIYLYFPFILTYGAVGTSTFSVNGYLNLLYNIVMSGTKFSEQFWFFWMILGTYLIMPIFNKWIKNCELQEIEYFLAIWLVTCLFYYSTVKIPIKLDYFTGPIGYVVLGYYLRYTDRKLFNNPYFGALVIVLSSVIMLVISVFLSTSSDMYLFQRYSFLVAVASAGVYILFKNFNKFKIANRFKDFSKSKIGIIFYNSNFSIAKYSYGIYLVHMLYVSSLRAFIIPYCNSYKLDLILLFIISFGLSWLTMALLSRIPHLSKIVGAK